MKRLLALPLATLALTACKDDDTSWIAELEAMREEIALQDSLSNAERNNLTRGPAQR